MKKLKRCPLCGGKVILLIKLEPHKIGNLDEEIGFTAIGYCGYDVHGTGCHMKFDYGWYNKKFYKKKQIKEDFISVFNSRDDD